MAHRPHRKLIALITGASAGMGRNFALTLLRNGYIVYGASRRLARMEDIVTEAAMSLAWMSRMMRRWRPVLNRSSPRKATSTS